MAVSTLLLLLIVAIIGGGGAGGQSDIIIIMSYTIWKGSLHIVLEWVLCCDVVLFSTHDRTGRQAGRY